MVTTNSPSRCAEAIMGSLFEIAIRPELVVPRYTFDGPREFVSEIIQNIDFHLCLGKHYISKTKLGIFAAEVLKWCEKHSDDANFTSNDGFLNHQAWKDIRMKVRAFISDNLGFNEWDK